MIKNILVSLVIIALLVFAGYKVISRQSKAVDSELSKTNVTDNNNTKVETPTKNPNAFDVNLSSSSVLWKGAMVSGVKSHTGTIAIKSGEGIFENGMVKSAVLIFDMSSIKEKDGNTQLETHLKSDDFFNVEAYPEAKLTTISVSTTTKVDVYNVKANLTIRDVTKEVQFPIGIKKADGILTATGKVTFNRADFNVKYGSKSFFKNLGDKVIKDEVEITVNVVTNSFEGAKSPSSI